MKGEKSVDLTNPFSQTKQRRKKPTTKKLINKKFSEILVPKFEDNVDGRIPRGCG